ncbi:MAG: TnpV protein, partial [Butyricicoccus sp.]|nr:TnpV protein [Butyricicoccus sp.]
MNELKLRIHDEQTGLDYILVGDYYIPAIELPEDDDRPIGKWGRMHRAYLKETNPLLLNHLTLTGELHSYLADLNEQAQERYLLIVQQMTE